MSVEVATPSALQPALEKLQIDGTQTEPGTSATGTNGSIISEETPKDTLAAKAKPRKLPFTQPAEASTRPTRVELSADEQFKYDIVLKHMKSITSLPVSSSKKNKETAPLSDVEQYFLSKECILRYLRATKWNVNEAQKRLEGTIIWRREYGTDTLTAEDIEPEALTGKQMLLGFDILSRPCLYLIPSRQNTDPSPRQIQQLVYSLERAIDMMPQGVQTLSLLVDFKHSSNSKNPSAGTGRQVLHILQTHYPERLGKALVINVPTFVWLFFKLITPFIDPNTREKLKFNENLREYVPPEQLYELFGGDCEFEYDHETFWPVYLKLASERREKYFARWKAAGGGIGQSEWDLRADDVESKQDATDVVASADVGSSTAKSEAKGKEDEITVQE